MSLTPKQRALYGRMGAAMQQADNDPRETTKKARAAFLDSFERKVRAADPTLPEAEVQRRATQLKRAYFLRLAAASSRARARKA